MAHRLQVFWISAISAGAQRRITHVAGRFPDGSRWELSAEEAFTAMCSGRLSLFIIRNGDIHDLTAVFEDGQYLLCASGDDQTDAQFLELPAFSPASRFPG